MLNVDKELHIIHLHKYIYIITFIYLYTVSGVKNIHFVIRSDSRIVI